MFGSYIAIARRIAAGNRWLVVAFAVLIGLWGVEFLAHGAVGVVRDLMTLKPTIDRAHAEACEAQYRVMTAAGNQNIPSLQGITKQMRAELIKRLREGCDIHFSPIDDGDSESTPSVPTIVGVPTNASPTTITEWLKPLGNWGLLGTIGGVAMGIIAFLIVAYIALSIGYIFIRLIYEGVAAIFILTSALIVFSIHTVRTRGGGSPS